MNPTPNRFFQLSLIFLVALNLVPHFNDHTIPTLAVGGVCLAWRLLYEYQLVKLPNYLTKVGLVMALFVLVYQDYGRILGLEPGSALLICAVSLKLVDRVAYRDAMVLLFLNFMLLLARFFESQTLGITIFAGFDLIITTALLVQLHKGSSLKFDFLTLIKTGGKLVLQISPAMILLFFIFPRFSGEFYRVKSRKTVMSGFSDSMSPGSLSGVAGANQLAFRVKFNGSTPGPLERYWRGAVLADNRGMVWNRGKFDKKTYKLKKNLSQFQGYSYELLLEPFFNDWLFTLDKPVALDQRTVNFRNITRELDGSIFKLERPVRKQFIYDVVSQPDKKDSLTSFYKETYTQKHEEKDPRVLKLVQDIKEGAKSNEHIAQRLMTFYQTGFRYTLNPGKLKSNELGEFVFEKKLGFCEHFAVSFAALMRLADVPSRVVIGFQGGQKNEMSEYYLVTSKDAHAWTEIWSEEKQTWLRFDPTVMVAPLRLDLGGDIFHSLTDEQQLSENGAEFLSQWNSSWSQQMRLAYDAMATNWNLFLINYDTQGQKNFFARLGFKNINQNMLLTLSLLILLCFFLWVRIRNRHNLEKISKAQIAYLDLRRKLAKKGIEKEMSEGPSDFLIRSQKEWPDQRVNLELFRTAYLEAEYGQQESEFNFKKSLSSIR